MNEGLMDSIRHNTPAPYSCIFWQVIKILKITSVSALGMQWLLLYEGRVALKGLLTYVIFRVLIWRKINKVQSSLLAEALRTGWYLGEMHFQRLLISAWRIFHMYWTAVLFYKSFSLSLLPDHFRKFGNAVCTYPRNSLFKLHAQSSCPWWAAVSAINRDRAAKIPLTNGTSLIPEVSNSNVSSKSLGSLLLLWLLL